jgi:chromosome partitioning protein
MLAGLMARERRLATVLEGSADEHDYVIIDCPPSLGLLTVNALTAADTVLIPIQCEYYALEGVGQLLKNIEMIKAHLNPGLHVSTVLLTMYDARTRLAALDAATGAATAWNPATSWSLPVSCTAQRSGNLAADKSLA